ncbi:MAG: mechanosensitive ion channel family protein [Muribaculaceae bacterium]|nr:mechanosensitive ion channel family protein [Muribaculaceae bacterium]
MTENLVSPPHYIIQLREMMANWFSLSDDSGIISIILFIIVILLAAGTYYLAIGILRVVAYLVEYTETDWDDDLINAPILKALSQLAPAIFIDRFLPYCFHSTGTFVTILNLITDFYIIWVTIYALNTFLDNLLYAFGKRPKFRPYAVKGIFQMGKLIFIGIGIIIAISLLVGKTPVAILTTLGASAAILMLVFKDTIMGLVASVQLTANKMVQKGDWIIVPKHNANGVVVEISLTTVKIKNWDNSITTVPPYSLVSESFQNYKAMQLSGARRICRHINIDVNSIHIPSDEEKERLKKEQLVPEIDPDSPGYSLKAIDNLSLFARYVESWLANNPDVRDDLLYMVRQLEPTTTGLPVEIYCFLNVTQWKEFEHIQSSILSYIYTLLPKFGLAPFQSPTGLDFIKAPSF